jgi:hypothetical protein
MTAARNEFLVEEYGPLPARSTGARIDTVAADAAWSDHPWAERDPSATEQRLQTLTWIEDILADIDSPA